MTLPQGIPKAALIAELEYQLARRSFADYCIRVSGDDYEQPAQVLALIDLLQRVESGEVKRAIVEMPPRSSKSTHISRLFPSWWLGRRPHENVILSSYGQELATGHGRAVRDLLGHPKYPFATKLRGDVKAAGRWQTEQGGGLIAAGVGTGLTGFGGNLVVLDDPIKDRQEAESEIVRNHTWDWYQDVLSTRVMREGAVVCLGTRWHEDDPIGRILATPGASDWVRLRIPYLAEDNDPLGRAPGQPLEVFGTVPSVEKGEISAYGFSALYQQSPTPAGGGVFRREWMQRRYQALPTNDPRWRVYSSVDLGGKQGVGHDPSAIATWGTDGISFYLLDYWSSQAEYADVKAKVIATFWEHAPRLVLVEDATWAQPLISDLRRETGVRMAPVTPIGSKWVRADAVSPLFEAGRIVLPQSAPWLDGWMHEHLSFPNAAHDEAVDTTSMALMRMAAEAFQVQKVAVGAERKVLNPIEQIKQQAEARKPQPERAPLGRLRG
jgi:predicted phage terminase large subunit-like protein